MPAPARPSRPVAVVVLPLAAAALAVVVGLSLSGPSASAAPPERAPAPLRAPQPALLEGIAPSGDLATAGCQVSLEACCTHTVSANCKVLCKYDWFVSTCTPGSNKCQAKTATPSPVDKTHPLFHHKAGSLWVGDSMQCDVH